MCPQYKNPSPKRNVKQLIYQKKPVVPNVPAPVQHSDPAPKLPRSVVDPAGAQSIAATKIKQLNVVLTCVNYSDFLIVSLSENTKIIDPRFITVVTDTKDLLTQSICKVFGVNYVVTDCFYSDGAVFNKGKALNEGIKTIINPDWILLTDADIVFPTDLLTILNNKIVNPEKLYATTRYLCHNYDTLLKYKANQITLSEMDGIHRCPPVGYFQLFSYNQSSLTNKNAIYPEISKDASWSDLLFADKFPQKECLQDIKLIHLGYDSQNWKGRKTKRFISDEIFSTLLNRVSNHTFTIHRRSSNQSDKLAVVTSFFNPANYDNIKLNYQKFKSGIQEAGVDLFTVELVFGGHDFFTEESEFNLHIRGGDNNIMWQKERLLNLLIDKIPNEYNNIAWIDCDVIFENTDWVDNINTKLKDYKFLQLFESAKFYDANNTINRVSDGIVKHLHDIRTTSKVDFNPLGGGTPGLAWAIRRESFNKVKLVDNQILGGGDSIMLLASIGFFGDHFIYKRMNEQWLSQTLLWGEKFYNEIQSSVFYIPGTVYHLYHGANVNRNYNHRSEYLANYSYDPRTDISLNDDNIWEWSNDKPILHDKVKNYFFEREEDDNLKQITNYFDAIFCINLDRRSDKWVRMVTQCQKYNIPIERVRAYDGNWTIVKQEWISIKRKLIAKYGEQMNKPSAYGLLENEFAYGTLCSHIQIVKMAKERKLKKILILEDDVIFDKNFNKSLIRLKSFDNWKLLYLGASQHNWNEIEIKDGYYHPKRTMGGFAYALDHTIYDDVLSLALISEKSFDNCLGNFNGNDIQTKYQNECYVLFPNLIIADVRDSDLREKRDINEHSIKMKWNLEQYDIT